MRERLVTNSPDEIFVALADPTRRAVLDLLRKGALPAGRIAQAFTVSRPAISKHLRRLRRARLVHERRAGRNRFYQLNPGPLRSVDTWLNRYRNLWGAHLASLKAYVETGQAKEAGNSRVKTKK